MIARLGERYNGNGGIEAVAIASGQSDWLNIVFKPGYFNPTAYHTSSDTADKLTFDPQFTRNGDYYYINSIKNNTSNRFTITKIDTIKNFFCGTFGFILYNYKNPKDSLIISDGRFDVRYHPK
jgi:hypothetical protein